MKNTLLAMLLGLSASAFAVPAVGPANLETQAAEDEVMIRIDEETGVAEMEENGQWIQLKAVELPEEAKVEKTQYYGYGYAAPCGTTVYAEPCQLPPPLPAPCGTCALPPPVDPCVSNCGVYAVPGYSYGYVRPYARPHAYDNYDYYDEAPAVAPPVVYPRGGAYRRGRSVYYRYPRATTYYRYPRHRRYR